ncbi:delta 9-fatty acid desaturase protein [Mycena metata]|uniref:Acyl-CoA desaturase n=1 Tax=Mycena metata TaxID=1033252 RepID=A0AAD7JCH1_9AGAR|nr:delta 9-fatty acid desaturase protein [Mycena metata]
MSAPTDATIASAEAENYVTYILSSTKPRPPISWRNLRSELDWVNVVMVPLVPLISLLGAYRTKLRWETALFAVVYYFYTGVGITAGYHRLWAHRSYNAGRFLEYFLAIAGAGAVQGPIRWWTRGHRAHHRYTDTELDPYNAQKGFWYSHMGWLFVKPRRKPGVADVSDLQKNKVVRWQNKYFALLMPTMAFVVPTVISWLGWGDARGGFVYAGFVRLCFVQQSTFCVNSLAHWLGESPFDDKHSPRDHLITALCTIGEGYHNFHHQFPMDYRNAIKWYQYDPTKWFIFACQTLGLASHLKVFPDNEVRKGQLTMQLKRLHETQESLSWPSDSNDLPIIPWDAYIEQASQRPLILIAGFIHDIASFIDEHPGGAHWIVKYIGRDATTAFFGGVYNHSNAAHNLLAMKRVGILQGGIPLAVDERVIPPSQRLKIARYAELASSGSSGYSEYDEKEGIA